MRYRAVCFMVFPLRRCKRGRPESGAPWLREHVRDPCWPSVRMLTGISRPEAGRVALLCRTAARLAPVCQAVCSVGNLRRAEATYLGSGTDFTDGAAFQPGTRRPPARDL